ncbi:hypothetical protein [Pseudobacteriovorax antillogorgiicola]|uniref:PilZ domain-containing protein n=1 Tax=Pseudobacteriovorax antillogorgiicola TaxID=1513793 RepID=A0A1Y6BRM1_9BACT|nr:hypothetical protein [Pseudobacteriovorax antillogorgiicola]TCS53815.1 hypothetical protein EDD56_107124 [Pseudobacteriovorax antillogorgiicola]SMF21970.1 hypothetical protein SAMN06296036_107148 [Pseudobacteriovorax antillogorgiicola]
MITNQTTLDTLKETAQSKTPIFLSTDDVDVVFQTTILSVEGQHLILDNKVPPEHISRVVASKKFYLQVQMLRMETSNIHSDGAHIIFPLANLNEIEDNRGAKRFFFEGDDVFLEVINPFDQETVLKKSVMDISTTGISIKSPMKSRLYEPGTRFTDMKILVNGEIYNRADGEVIYNRRFLDLRGKYYYQVGLRFDSPVQN